jgi:O-antigen biosynthesis protein
MHRGGTSAVTEALASLGVALGDRLHPPREDNPHGFFEDQDCWAINEQLLQYLGSAWDRLVPEWKFIESDATIGALRVQAAQLIVAKKLEHGRLWGFKDPRTARLLAFWQQVIRSCGFAPSYLIAIRNPLSVALSLQKRDQMPAEKCYLLWIQHVLPAILDTEESPRVLVDYDLLVQDPAGQLSRIAKVLNIDAPPEVAPGACVREILDPQLRHSIFAPSDLRLDFRVPEDVVTAYDMLTRIARDEIAIDDRRILEHFAALRSRLNSCFSIFQYLDKLADDKIAFSNTLAERDTQMSALRGAALESEAQITQLRRSASEKVTEIGALDGSRSENSLLIVSLNHAVAEQAKHLESFDKTVTSQAGQIASLKEIIAQYDESQGASNRSLAEKNAQLASLNQTLVERDNRDRALEGSLAGLMQEISALKAADAALKNSLSWRITAPLRYVFGLLLRRS